MKKISLNIQRKSRLAYKLVRQSDWSQFLHKLRRNLNPVIDSLTEVYRLGRDVMTHNYWQRRNRTNGTLFDATLPFSLEPVPRPDGQRKNVVWIMLDALRQDVFNEYLKRGGLANLTGNSAYFSRAFAQGSWTYPSVFSFLTGRYPFNCGVSRLTYENGKLISLCSDFDDSCPTIFSILRQHGYQVASILDGWGFTVRTTAGQEHREDRYFEDNWGWIYGQDQRFLSLPELRDASLSYIRRAAKKGPFMLFVRSLYTHSPYRDIFKSPDYVTALSRRRWAFRITEGFVRGLRRFEGIYLKSLLATLTELGQLENTIIIISSDHGEMLWNVEGDLKAGSMTDEEMWRHQLEPYNALIKVPLLIWGAQMRGVYPHRFRLMDLVPTLLEELGLGYDPGEFDGASARHTIARPLYADSAGSGYGGVSFQTEGPKLLMSRRVGAVSYDLTEDEYEDLNLRHDAVDGVAELAQFVQQVSRSPDTIVEQGDEEILMRRLEALGYI